LSAPLVVKKKKSRGSVLDDELLALSVHEEKCVNSVDVWINTSGKLTHRRQFSRQLPLGCFHFLRRDLSLFLESTATLFLPSVEISLSG